MRTGLIITLAALLTGCATNVEKWQKDREADLEAYVTIKGVVDDYWDRLDREDEPPDQPDTPLPPADHDDGEPDAPPYPVKPANMQPMPKKGKAQNMGPIKRPQLWKADSENRNGCPVILLAAEDRGRYAKVELHRACNMNKGSLIEKMRLHTDKANGWRSHYYCNKAKGKYPKNLYVVAWIWRDDGGWDVKAWLVKNPANRQE